jgi:4-hydroxythreonine-4-phosphate dehydrogenase
MLALTMGDPAGIGGELTVQLLAATSPPFVVLDDPARLAAYHRAPIREVGSVAEARAVYPAAIPVLRIALPAPVHPGRPDPANAPAVIASIERAVQLALAGEVAAIVTNPISKATLYSSGFPYPGHTEFLAALTGAAHPVMMLAAPALRVVPVTIHVSLRAALDQLTTARNVATARITHAALQRDFALAAPRLAIAGLNPHAGEHGALGDEEQRIIAPAIQALRAQGITVTGPWPPDTMFTPAARASYDVAICMYHDQALIPLKTLDRDHGVNVTLGLPIVRTSPDHGTAFDIAGTGQADATSLRAAMELAAELGKARPGALPLDPAGDPRPQTPIHWSSRELQ